MHTKQYQRPDCRASSLSGQALERQCERVVPCRVQSVLHQDLIQNPIPRHQTSVSFLPHADPRFWTRKFTRASQAPPSKLLVDDRGPSSFQPRVKQCEQASSSLFVASANVNTLHARKVCTDALTLSARVQILEQSFLSKSLDVVGVQEGRTRGDQRKSGCIYEMFVAGCDEACNYGAQIWVRRCPRHVIQGWLVHSPRLIEVTIVCSVSKSATTYFSAHAPHEYAEPATND